MTRVFLHCRLMRLVKLKLYCESLPTNINQTWTVKNMMNYYLLCWQILRDPVSYKKAMQSKERDSWKKSINEELKSMNTNQMWKIMNRPEECPMEVN